MSILNENQPNINIGLIGHVSNGKTSIVSAISKKDTKQFKLEKKVGKTVKLGYANAKIWKCENCSEPECFHSTSSEQYYYTCSCGTDCNMIAHVSFVDSPGHNSLMATMLNGTCITDFTILVESVSNQAIPAPQTEEHMRVANSLKLNNICICLNKLDLETKENAMKKRDKLRKSLKNTIYSHSKIIPISANSGTNINYLLQEIVNKVNTVNKDNSNEYCRAVIVRSFNINKQNIPIDNIESGVIGGSIMRGSLQVGDNITIYPGYCIGEKYCPIKTSVKEIFSEKNKIESAFSGGLIGIKTDLDPVITHKDQLAGSCVVKGNVDIKVYNIIRCFTEYITEDKDNLQKNDTILINCNGKNIYGKILKLKKDGRMEIKLAEPVCIEINDKVSISSINNNIKKLVRTGEIVEGEECTQISIDTLFSMIK